MNKSQKKKKRRERIENRLAIIKINKEKFEIYKKSNQVSQVFLKLLQEP